MAQRGDHMQAEPIAVNRFPHRPLGNTGVQISCLGVGGYHLGSTRDQEEANQIVAGRSMPGSIFSITHGTITTASVKTVLGVR